MQEFTPQTIQNLFQTDTMDVAPKNLPISEGFSGSDLSQSDKDAILRQIHPIFLNTHQEERAPVIQSNFDKFLNFLRLSLEGSLKLIDILVDAAIQITRLFVGVIAILGILIVITLMTNTTDKFIDILNSSIFPIIGIETTIQKVGPTTPIVTLPTVNPDETTVPQKGEDVIVEDVTSDVLDITTPVKKSRQEILRERRLREAQN